jgi:hypothetical protein
VVGTNKCVFYGCDDTQSLSEGPVNLNKLLNNIPNKNYYFYTHNYGYNHFKDEDKLMPFQIEFSQDSAN